MTQASLEIPEGLVGPLRETVVLLYQATAEALHLGLRAHTQRDEPVDEVQEHRARLAELDALLERLGWGAKAAGAAPAGSETGASRDVEGRAGRDLEGRAGRDLEVTAPRDILHDALYGALIDAGERLAVACDNAWRGEDTLETVRAAATEVIGLDRLLGALDG